MQLGQAIYFCPMHPQVRQGSPGYCSQCGMSLVSQQEHDSKNHGGKNHGGKNRELEKITRRFWQVLFFSLPVIALSMGTHLLGQNWITASLPAHWRILLELFFATPVCTYLSYPFYSRALASLAQKKLNMFTLIASGVFISYFYSTIAALFPSLFPASFRGGDGEIYLYFETSVTIVTLVLLGQVLETRAHKRTGAAIRHLLQLAPAIAHRIDKEGEIQDVALQQVQRGDRLQVRPGEKIPVDGIILEGESLIDMSFVSGEAMPKHKKAGDKIIGATINKNSVLIMQAERVGSETLLARIVQMVTEAQSSRASVQRLADTVTNYFVPAVIFIALFSFMIWFLFGPQPSITYAMLNAVAVLIIACPCALGLATPISIMVAVGAAARRGILFRDAEAVEALCRIDTLAFDKTGTLTQGKAQLVTKKTFRENYDLQQTLYLAASLEKSSEHPLAAAIVESFHQQNSYQKRHISPTIADFKYVPGKGVTGKVENQHIAVGNQALMHDLQVDIEEAIKEAKLLQAQGQTIVFISIDGILTGLLGLADPIKKSSYAACQTLKRAGIHLIMITGDSHATAKIVSEKLGIDSFISDLLPDQKVAIVGKLQEEGKLVAMAGDGINDAPALAKAHVGIAMGSGSDIAIESAAVTLVKGDLKGILDARLLSKAAIKNIRQNLFFAFIYNALSIPIAAGLLYPFFGILLTPIIAAAAMSFSSVSVIANALRLQRIKF